MRDVTIVAQSAARMRRPHRVDEEGGMEGGEEGHDACEGAAHARWPHHGRDQDVSRAAEAAADASEDARARAGSKPGHE